MWKMSFSASTWTLWKAARCLDSKAFCMEDLTEKVKFSEKRMGTVSVNELELEALCLGLWEAQHANICSFHGGERFCSCY